MAPGDVRRTDHWWIIGAVVTLVVVIIVVWTSVSPSSQKSPPPGTAVLLTESSLPSEIQTAGGGYSQANWQWPVFNDRPCTNQTVPAFNCTSLDAVLSPGNFFNFSFEIHNGASYPAEIVDLETNVNYSYSSVPSQYCNGGGVPEVGGPSVGADSTMLITMNLTMPSTPGTYNPDLTLVTVIGGCSGSDCGWGC